MQLEKLRTTTEESLGLFVKTRAVISVILYLHAVLRIFYRAFYILKLSSSPESELGFI